MKEELLQELLSKFPNRLLKNYSKIMDFKFEKKIRKELREEILNDITLKKFLIENYGFIDGASNLFDYQVIKHFEEYYNRKGNYSRKIYEKAQNVSRQMIQTKIKETLEKKINLNWEIEKLNEVEEDCINDLIKNKKFEIELDKIFVVIIRNGKRCSILIYDKINKEYRVITNQNHPKIQLLLKNYFHKYSENDFLNIEYLKNHNKNGVVQVAGKNLKNSTNKKNISIEKYIEFLGYEYQHPNKEYSDNEIKKILNKYIYQGTEKDIYIPTDYEDANKLRVYASRYENGIKGLITRLGFIYHIRDTKLRTIETLKKFSNEKQEVYLPAIGSFYHSLCIQANRKDFLLDEYIKELGFVRIENMAQLELEEEIAQKIDIYYNSLKIQRRNSCFELGKENDEFIKKVENGLEHINKINEREALVKKRLTQGLFRERLLKLECKCKICDINSKDFLIASHIKPWVDSEDYEKVDINNGFLLCPNHDKLFDSGYISFEDDGTLIISKNLPKSLIKEFNLELNNKIKINEDMKKYLEYHREERFK